MQKMIVGLGNPGEEYENTRHNSGLMFIDHLCEKYAVVKNGKLKHSRYFILDNGLIIIKPDTFMNNSGLAVKEAVKWFDIDIENLIIAHDDLDISLGDCKYQFAKSPRDHNGIRSVEDHLGTNKFYRIRIGIDNRGGKKIDGERYVLESFSAKEREQLNKCLEKALSVI